MSMKNLIFGKVIKFCVIFLFFSGFFTSCESEVKISADSVNDLANIEFNSSMGKELESLVTAIVSAGGNSSAETVLFDAKSMENGLSAAGFVNSKVQVKNKTSIFLKTSISNAKKGLNSVSGLLKNTGDSLILTVSPKIVQDFSQSLGEDLHVYLDLLMAPVFTGEPMNANEYSELIASVYGQGVANELNDAKLKINLALGKKSKSFELPLVELLILSKEIQFEVK